MAKIHLLPLHEAQKIAAGEVVERPANVVKELVENALDAGATQITLFVEDGGKKLIRVIDNGCGMSAEDAHLAVVQHATSKITSVNDLEKIATFGFRGEALASIVAVSECTLITKEAASAVGTKLVFEGGVAINEESLACNTGTEIVVKNIFYNVPARQKFLKTRETEWRAIVQFMQAVCLDYYNLSFKIYHDDVLQITCPPAKDLQTRVLQLFGTQLGSGLLSVSEKDNSLGASVYGVISPISYTRYDRNQIFIFVNRRWIKNYKLGSALLKGYANVLPHDKYPAACIFIDVPAHEVDINIHPRKEEVQFLHPRKVELLVQHAVKNALEHQVSKQLGKVDAYGKTSADYVVGSVPGVNVKSVDHTDFIQVFDAQKSFEYKFHSEYNQGISPTQSIIEDKAHVLSEGDKLSNLQSEAIFTSEKYSADGNVSRVSHIDSSINLVRQAHHMQSETALSLPAEAFSEGWVEVSDEKNSSLFEHTDESVKNSKLSYTLIGQMRATYILIETEEGMTVIDQHAAHERILYEQFSSRFSEVATVPLLFPTIISLSQEECTRLELHKELFSQHGITLEQFGPSHYSVTALPVHLKNQSISELVKLVLAERGTVSDVHHALRATMACKAAIKAGDILTVDHMHELIDQLVVCPNRLTCPHGRPTSWVMSFSEIEKKFKRRL